MNRKLIKHILLVSMVFGTVAAIANTIACYQSKGDKTVWSSWQSQICVCDPSKGSYDCTQSAWVTQCTKQDFSPDNDVQYPCNTEETETGQLCHYADPQPSIHIKQYLAPTTCPKSCGCGTYVFDKEWDQPYSTVDDMGTTDSSGNTCDNP